MLKIHWHDYFFMHSNFDEIHQNFSTLNKKRVYWKVTLIFYESLNLKFLSFFYDSH